MVEKSDEVGTVDLRCPMNQSRLFAKVVRPKIVEGNLIEVVCRDCRAETTGASRVMHRFDPLGEYVESVLESSDGTTWVTY